jgi:fibronectin type 3 domain-containing protein
MGSIPAYTIEVGTRRGKYSATSNSDAITIVQTPGVVANLSGYMDQHRIWLKWQPPAQDSVLPDIYIVRREDGAIPPQAIPETHFEDTDVEAGKSYVYVVTAARGVAAPVPGKPSLPLSVVAIDKTRPAAPAGLQPLFVSDSGAILRWDPNIESDIAGYWIYRSDNPGIRLNTVMDTLTSYRDPDYKAGASYAVSAEDMDGNESSKSQPARAP